MPLQNDAPVMAGMSPPIGPDDTVTVYFPLSAVCTVIVNDLNDEMLTVDYSGVWDGEFTHLGQELGTKRIVPLLTTRLMGVVFTGEWIISDQAGAQMNLPYAARRILLDRFSHYPPQREYWELYRWNDTGRTIQPRIDRAWGDTTLQFVFETDSGMGLQTTGMYSSFGLGGDFSISLEYQLSTRIGPGFDCHFVVCNRADTSYLFAGLGAEDRMAGFHLSHGGIGYGIFGGAGGEVIDHLRDASSGTLRIDRNAGEISFFHQYRFLDEPDTLLYPHESHFLSESLLVHIRMSVDNLDTPRSCRLMRFKVDRGVLVATSGRE